MNNRIFCLILICGLLCVSGVSAHDQFSLNTTDTSSDSNLNTNTILNPQINNSISNNTTYNSSASNRSVLNSNITVGNQSKSLTDLKNLLSKSPGNYTLNDDYQFNST